MFHYLVSSCRSVAALHGLFCSISILFVAPGRLSTMYAQRRVCNERQNLPLTCVNATPVCDMPKCTVLRPDTFQCRGENWISEVLLSEKKRPSHHHKIIPTMQVRLCFHAGSGYEARRS